jgi:hypothetical protein
MINNLLKSILLISFAFLSVSSCSHKSYDLVNRTWDAYTTTEKGGDTTNNYFITYTFNSDGTFVESHKFRDISKIQTSYKKAWKLNNNVLTVSLIRESDGIQKITEFPIEWLNNSKFVTVEKNDVTGLKTYVYYYARN